MQQHTLRVRDSVCAHYPRSAPRVSTWLVALLPTAYGTNQLLGGWLSVADTVQLERMEWVERLYARQGDVRNTHHLGDKQWDYCLDLLRRAGRGGTPAPEADAAEEGGTGAKPPLSAVVELRRRQRDFIRLSKEVYDDAGGARPAYTGEPDTYRARQYRVDRAANSWGVTVPP